VTDENDGITLGRHYVETTQNAGQRCVSARAVTRSWPSEMGKSCERHGHTHKPRSGRLCVPKTLFELMP
jgi:hypothetical protein